MGLLPRNASGKFKNKVHKNDGKSLRNEASVERRFGQQVRHLEKIVRKAYLNPSEFSFLNYRKTFSHMTTKFSFPGT
jgi:hypothetical protein